MGCTIGTGSRRTIIAITCVFDTCIAIGMVSVVAACTGIPAICGAIGARGAHAVGAHAYVFYTGIVAGV